ncbi:MAG: Fis family transcriptional regulator [Alphaproteobacteria bacterium]|nr:Fis family transcriptional regulator [Alphaproteobacteria bacterium]MDD9920193.1 Fis family transcriptional regulator [Alphaproteobacteria bacterium]
MSQVAQLSRNFSTKEAEEDLQRVVDQLLVRYFQTLGGVSPAANMYTSVIQTVEKPLLESVLRYAQGNQVRAASILGINRNTLRKKINVLGIDLTNISAL